MNILKIIFIAMITFSFAAESKVYKCVDKDNVIHYQSVECSDNNTSSVMNVKEYEAYVPKPVKKQTFKSSSKPDNNLPVISSNELIAKQNQQAKKLKCASLNKEYKSLKKSEVDNCKQQRQIYCDKGADSIAETRYRKDQFDALNTDISDRPRLRRGTTRIKSPPPPRIMEIKMEMGLIGCKISS